MRDGDDFLRRDEPRRARRRNARIAANVARRRRSATDLRRAIRRRTRSRSRAPTSASRRNASSANPRRWSPAIPPTVQNAPLDGSTGKRSPCARAARSTSARTAPGPTRIVRACDDRPRRWSRHRLRSTITPSPIAPPGMLLPEPRGMSGVAVDAAHRNERRQIVRRRRAPRRRAARRARFPPPRRTRRARRRRLGIRREIPREQ